MQLTRPKITSKSEAKAKRSRSKQEAKPKRNISEMEAKSNQDKKQAMINALSQTLGIVTQAVKICGISSRTHHTWTKEDEEYAFAVQEITDLAIDFAEKKLFELIDGAEKEVVTQNGKVVTIKEAPNTSATIFYLKTKGKKRGYIERQEITGEEGRPIIHIAGNI